MNKQDLMKIAEAFVENSEYNRISEGNAISEKVVGLKMFETPIFGFGDAEDEYFELLKEPNAIGDHFLLPREWLPKARTVISFFLPFTNEVKEGNKRDKSWPSEEWLHGRIEGQVFIQKLCQHLNAELINNGYEAVVPSKDKRFLHKSAPSKNVPVIKDSKIDGLSFTSNWSERHVAFVCGLGTFGLSRGIITRKGMAGRLGSIITELYLPPDEREYKDIYEYCSRCGACARNCPAKAISLDEGKNHTLCSDFLDITNEKYKPRYGCGKCQVGVPCESRIPKQRGIK